MSTNSEADLQTRYTQLLEQRIAHLERLVTIPNTVIHGVEKNTEVNEASKSESSSDSEEDVAPDINILETRYRNVVRRWDRKSGAHKDEVCKFKWYGAF